MSKTHYIIPIFIPHKGCPFDCVFCNQKRITGTENDPTGISVNKMINKYYKTIPFKENVQVEIAFFGGSFTGIDIKKQKELLAEANRWKSDGLVKDIRISTRPDYISIHILDILKKFGVTIIELGVQSLDDEVLMKSGRGHTARDVEKAVELIKEYEFKLGLQMMVGLPNDTKEKSLITADGLIQLQPDFVRIYPTLIIKDTYLEQLFLTGRYEPLSLAEAVDISKDIFIKFAKKMIPVIRIGLQPSDEIGLDGAVIAGPFHPSFRQLVESEIIKDFIEHVIKNSNMSNKESVIKIKANKTLISSIAGQKKSNISYLKNTLNIKSIMVLEDNTISKNCVVISNDNKEVLYDLDAYIINEA